VRDLSNLLRPSALDDLGLIAALRALSNDVADRSRLTIDLELLQQRLGILKLIPWSL
jgi:signal transduction histidine kinase